MTPSISNASTLRDALVSASSTGAITICFCATLCSYDWSTLLLEILTGETTEQVEAGMAAGGESRQCYLDALGESRLQLCPAAISADVIREELSAFAELHGSDPELIILHDPDNFAACQTLPARLASETSSRWMVVDSPGA